MMPMEQIVQQVMLWALTGVLGVLAGWTTSTLRKERGESKALRDGMRSLLRGEIMRIHHQGVREGFLSTLDKEILQRDYEAYHGIDGNGTGTVLYEEGMKLPTVDDPAEQKRLREEAER